MCDGPVLSSSIVDRDAARLHEKIDKAERRLVEHL